MVVHRASRAHQQRTVNGAALRCHCGVPIVSLNSSAWQSSQRRSIAVVATIDRLRWSQCGGVEEVRNTAQRRSGGLTTRRCCHRCETCGSTSCRPEPSTATSKSLLDSQCSTECEYTKRTEYEFAATCTTRNPPRVGSGPTAATARVARRMTCCIVACRMSHWRDSRFGSPMEAVREKAVQDAFHLCAAPHVCLAAASQPSDAPWTACCTY